MPSKLLKKHENKEKFYFAVLNAAVTLDIRRGHLKWKISDLARASRVSRTLLYYYFGKSKDSILHEAVRLFGDELAGSTPEKEALWSTGRMHESALQSRTLLKKVPALVPFYFLNRDADTEVGAAIREREERFLEKIHRRFPNLPKEKQEGIFALFMGILLAPDTANVDPLNGIEMILAITGKPGIP